MSMASRLPMRNWNIGMNFRSTLNLALPDYLWGIETSVKFVNFGNFEASRLPMRNWNTKKESGRDDKESFQTTYEELKPAHPTRTSWKRCIASRLPMRNWNNGVGSTSPRSHRFQTTYEELKLDHSRKDGKPVSASRLPMRNWNLVAAVGHLPQVYFASRLPMRNWNETRFSSFRTASRASRLPMRNWNAWLSTLEGTG